MIRALYLLYGLGVLTLFGAAEYKGWNWTDANEAKIVPRSVRENPGAYRPIYLGSSRYLHGK